MAKEMIPPPDRPLLRPATIGHPDATPTALALELRSLREKEDAGGGAPDRTERPQFLEYAQHLLTAKRKRLDFTRFAYQQEIYRVFGDERVKDVVLMKSVQVGASELLSRLALYYADLYSLTVLYVFPALKQMQDFSDTRVRQVIEANEYLRGRVRPGDVMNKGLKQIDSGHVFFRGSESRNDLISIDADLVVLDEYDSLQEANIPDAERRIAASQLGLIRRVGVPSDPDFGIAKLYDQSDRRQWQVSCGACGEQQPLSFADNLRWEQEGELIVNDRLVCRRCESRLDVRRGEWIAECPERARPGFHVHRLMVPDTNLVSVIEASLERQPYRVHSFHNNDLGLPHADQTGGLDRLAIAAARSAGASAGFTSQVQGYDGPNLVTAGIDVASARALHMRISEHIDPPSHPRARKRALFIGTVDSFEEVAAMLDRYKVDFACVDAAPEGRLAIGLTETFPGRVWVARYVSQQELIDVVEERRLVSAQRTPVLDETVTLIQAQRNLLPEDLPADYVDHMIAPRRRIRTDQYDRKVAVYESRRPDDYFHAEVYDLLATKVANWRVFLGEMCAKDGELTLLHDLLGTQSELFDGDGIEERRGSAEDDFYSAGFDYGPALDGDDRSPFFDDGYHSTDEFW